MKITVSKEEIKLVEYDYDVPQEMAEKIELLLNQGKNEEVENIVNKLQYVDKTEIDCYNESITDISCRDNTYIIKDID